MDASETKRPSTVPAEVLDTLIDARLLTSYELPAEDDENAPQQRIEIIHESLLSNWPRLVRWQAQDEEGAILRDQLRQAAQMWEERGHPEDLLWTGTSYNEYQLWRERYAGGLSTAEEEFAQAMTAKAERRKRQRRVAIAAAFAVLLTVLAVVVASLQEARRQALRAEANQLLALGRLEIEDNPTGALGYAIASLERADERVTRLFALEALWRGPPAMIVEGTPTNPVPAFTLDFSPDGKWLAAGSVDPAVGGRREIKLWPSDAGTPSLLERWERDLFFFKFGADSDRLVIRSYPSHEVQIRSVPDGRLLRTLPTQGPVDFRLAGDPERVFTFTRHGEETRVEAWPMEEGGPELFGELGGNLHESANWYMDWSLEVDPSAARLAYSPRAPTDRSEDMPSEIYLVGLDKMATIPSVRLGRHPEWPGTLAFHPDGEHLASADESGEVRIWDIGNRFQVPKRVLHHPPGWTRTLAFEPSGSRLAAGSASGHTALWDLEGPPDAEPLLLRRSARPTFHPEGHWLATASEYGVALWPTERPYPLELKGHKKAVQDLEFLPGGKSLVSVSQDGTLRLWPLSPAAGGSSRILFDVGPDWLTDLAVDPAGRRILITGSAPEVWLVPVDEGEARQLEIDAVPGNAALGEETAAAVMAPLEDRGNRIIRVWDLETGEFRDIETASRIWNLQLTPDGRLVSGGRDGVRIWNLENGEYETLSERAGWIELSRDGRRLFVNHTDLEGQLWDPVLYDLEAGDSVEFDSHGPVLEAVIDDSGTILATISDDSAWLQVGPATGGAPHLLAGQVNSIGPISPDGRWLTSVGLAEEGNTIRLWPMPDLSQPPLHTLPHDELMAKLRTLTNLRVVKDPESETGWGWSLDPFPGWERVPTW